MNEHLGGLRTALTRTMPIRLAITGEMIDQRADRRQHAPARREDGIDRNIGGLPSGKKFDQSPLGNVVSGHQIGHLNYADACKSRRADGGQVIADQTWCEGNVHGRASFVEQCPCMRAPLASKTGWPTAIPG